MQTWSDALDRHDLSALESLYADSVEFYGHELPRSRVIQAKRTAFAKQPDFHHQLIGNIDVQPASAGTFAASFLKRSDGGGHTLVVTGALTLVRTADGSVRVTRESDQETGRRKVSDVTPCQETAASAAQSLPQVKLAVERARKAADESGGAARFGGIGPQEDGDGLYGAIGIHTDERFEAYVTYSVDAGGHFTVTASGDELSIPASLAHKVAAACKR